MTEDRLILDAGWLLEPAGTVRRDAAVLVEHGRIRAIENRSELAGVEVEIRLGGPDFLVLPGLVNAHQHGRPDDTVNLGIADAPLECWLVDLLASPEEDPYRRTLRHTVQLARAGITTVVHMHSSFPPTAEAYDTELRAVLSGYHDGGIRVVLAVALRDRGVPVYGDTDKFLTKARAAQGNDLDWLPALPPRDAVFEVIDGLHDDAAAGRFGDAHIAYGPAGPPWCSDALLAAIAQRSTTSGTIVHTHLLETRGERRFGAREHERGAVGALADLGLLSDRLLIAHGVWLDAHDCHLLASSGVSVVTNPSSNLRLHAGIAPIRELLDAGVNVALGTDNLTLGGEDEILQDARLLRALQRTPEVSDTGIDVGVILSMATKSGGLAIGRPDVGVLTPGAVGDAVLINLASRRDALRIGSDPRELALASRPTAISHTIAAGRILVDAGEPVIGPCRQSVRWPDASDRKRVEALMPLVRRHYE